jgi:hypothetical protein
LVDELLKFRVVHDRRTATKSDGRWQSIKLHICVAYELELIVALTSDVNPEFIILMALIRQKKNTTSTQDI